jgi:Ca2+-binding EF-hand superfamily protein
MDLNRDGSITAVELQRALRLTQASSEFDMKTIELLISKYDTNGDREISFEEFFDLYNNLNEEYETFLLTDADGSGLIDLDEFTSALKNKGYFFGKNFYEHIVHEICKRTKKSGIQFDIYIRVAARFDQLCQQYNRTLNYSNQKSSLENYLKKNFFENFW